MCHKTSCSCGRGRALNKTWSSHHFIKRSLIRALTQPQRSCKLLVEVSKWQGDHLAKWPADRMAKHLSERCTESCPLHAREINAQAVHLEQRLGQHHGHVHMDWAWVNNMWCENGAWVNNKWCENVSRHYVNLTMRKLMARRKEPASDTDEGT